MESGFHGSLSFANTTRLLGFMRREGTKIKRELGQV